MKLDTPENPNIKMFRIDSDDLSSHSKKSEVSLITNDREEKLKPSLSSRLYDSNDYNEKVNCLLRVNSNLFDQHFDNVSLFIFESDNRFRLKVQYIISLKLFNAIIITLIILNTIFLVFETINQLKSVAKISNYIFTYLFTIEFLMKIISYGFVLDDNSYLRDPWNWLDFLVVITGLLSFFPKINANLFALRTFRLLRPLKSINALPNMKIFIITLINSLGDLGNIFFLTLFFFIIFGVTGLSIWSERLHYRCRISNEVINGTLILNSTYKEFLCGGKNKCGNKSLCINSMKYYLDGKIKNKTLIEEENNYYGVNYGVTNYQNILISIFINLYTYTGEGWGNIMLQYMDGYNYFVSFIFFALSIIINYYFMLNLTIAMLLYNFEKTRNFNRQKENYLKDIDNDNEELSKREKKNINKQIINSLSANNYTVEVSKRLYRLRYVPLRMKRKEKKKQKIKRYKCPKLFQQFPIKSSYHRKYKITFICYVIYHQPIVQMFFYLCILLNAGILTLDRVDITKKENQFLNTSNFILVIIFTFENILNIIGIGIKEFKKSYFNVFDFSVVLITLINSIIKEIRKKDISSNVTAILRMLRTLRIFKVFEKRQFFRVILESIKITVLRMVDYILVFLIFLYMFTLLGYSFFHNGLQNDIYNFRNFISSLITTFRIIIGDRWQEIFYNCYISNNISNFATYLYFVSILFFGHIILMNIFLAYLVENFIKTKRVLEQNVNVRNFILNINYDVSSLHFLQLKEMTNNKKKKEIDITIKSLDKVLQKMNNKKLLMEEEFKLLSRIKIDFNLSKAYLVENGENIEQKDEKSNDSQIEFDAKYKIETHSNIKVKVFEDNTFKSSNPILDKIDLYQQYITTIPFYKFNIRYWKKFTKRRDGKYVDSSTIMLTHESLIEQLEDSIKPKIESKSTRNVKKYSHFKLSSTLKNNSKIKLNNNKYQKEQPFQNSKPVKKDENDFDDGSINTKELEKRNNDSFNSMEEEEEEEINDTSSNFEDKNSSDNNNENINNVKNKKSKKSIKKEKEKENKKEEDENSIANSDIKDETANQNMDINIKKIGTYYNLKRRPSILYEEKAKNEVAIQMQILNQLMKEEDHHNELPSETNSNSLNDNELSNNLHKNNLKNLKIKKFAIIWEYMKNSSLFIFHKDSSVRKFIRKLVYYQIFNLVIIILIILNCFEMCLDNNWIDPNSKYKKALNYMNKFFNIVFLIEAILKIISNDFIWQDPEDLNSIQNLKKIISEYEQLDKNNTEYNSDVEYLDNNNINKQNSLIFLQPIINPFEKQKLIDKAKTLLENHPAYLKDSSNIIDFICVCFGTADLFVSRDLSYFKTLRAFRAIKPIRLLAKSENLNLMIKCLIKSIPSIGSVFIVGGFIIFLFCLLGVNLFKNKLRFYCSGFNFDNEIDCINNGHYWFKNNFNFNHFLYALSTNIQIIFSENWGDMMKIAENRYKERWVYWYYFIIIILGNMILLNLIVGVLIEEFKSIKEEETNYVLLTESEIEWIHVQKVMLKAKPYVFIPDEENVSDFKAKCIKIISDKWFENAIIISIVSSLVILMLQYGYSPKGYKIFLDILNYIFTLLFNIEILLKIYVRKSAFFYLNWNIFDFIILCLCDIMMIITLACNLGGISSIFLIIRCLRTLKLMRKIPYLQKIKSIIDSLSYLVSSLTSVALIMLVVIIIYANVGMSFFGNLPYRKYINNKLNFRNFLTTSILLFQITTKEEWSNFMFESAYHDCKDPTSISYQQDSYCVTYNIICYPENLVNYTSMKKYNMFSCGNDLSYFYFISYMIIGPLFIMNLCIVMVIEGFYEAVSDNEGLLTIDYLDTFIEVWMKYDSQCSNLVKPYEFVLMFKELQPPIGINYDRLIWKFNMNREDERGKLLSLRNFINKIHDKGLEVNDFEHLCNETKNAFEFKDYYISKDMKFNTNDKEVMMLTHKLQINPSELKDSSNEKNIFSKFQKKIRSLTKVKDNIFNDSNSDDSKANELKLINEKFKDYYVHYIEACLALSRFAVSTMCDCTFESLRYNLVNVYTKKYWLNEYKNDKLYISNTYLEKNSNLEDVKLSEYLASKILYKKALKNRILFIRKKIIEKQEQEEQKNLIDEMGTFKIEKEKNIAVFKNYFKVIDDMKRNKKLGIIGKQIHFGRFSHNNLQSDRLGIKRKNKRISLVVNRPKNIKDINVSDFYKNEDLKK